MSAITTADCGFCEGPRSRTSWPALILSRPALISAARSASECAEPRCSRTTSRRFFRSAICTAVAPDAVFTFRRNTTTLVCHPPAPSTPPPGAMPSKPAISLERGPTQAGVPAASCCARAGYGSSDRARGGGDGGATAGSLGPARTRAPSEHRRAMTPPPPEISPPLLEQWILGRYPFIQVFEDIAIPSRFPTK